MSNSAPDSDVSVMAVASWVCPVLAWLSQVWALVVLRGSHGNSLPSCFLALLQLALIITGLFLGVRALSRGSAGISSSARWSAIVGIVLSGGTILLVAVAALTAPIP